MVEIIVYVLSLFLMANSHPLSGQPANPSPLEAYGTYVNEHYKEALEKDTVSFYYEDITHDGTKDLLFCDRRYSGDNKYGRNEDIKVYLLTLSDRNEVNCFYIDEYRSTWNSSYYLVDYEGKRCILRYATGHFAGTNMTNTTDYQYEIYYYDEDGKKVICEQERDAQRLYKSGEILPEDPAIIAELQKFQEKVEGKKSQTVVICEYHTEW